MDQAEADLMARGVPPAQARRATRLRYGDGLAAREDVRRYGWEGWVDTLLTDLRLSVRTLRQKPGFAAVVVLTLGMGIGAVTAIFSVVRPVLFEPLAYPDPDRLLSIDSRAEDGTLVPSTYGTYLELSRRSRGFGALAVLKPWQPTLTGGEEPERLEGQSVSGAYFEVLGVPPAVGPGFAVADDRPGGAHTVILSDALWRTRFGADPGIVGRLIRLDGEPYTVVGVMPRSFENVTAPQARAWTLLQYDPSPVSFESREWGHHLDMVGRLRAGTGMETARQELDDIAHRPLPGFPRPSWATLSEGLSLRLLKDATTADARPAMLVFLGAVGLLLAVTCANLTLLLLARGTRRRGEFAMRSALGAARARLARFLLTESLVMSTLGGLVGILMARGGVSILVALSPASLPRLHTIGLDGPALALALVLTTAVGIVFALAPGLHRSGGLPQAIRESSRTFVRGNRIPRRALVVSQVAIATILLVGTGLLLRSTQRLFSLPLGFDPSAVVVVQIHANGLEEGDAFTHRFFDQALAAVRSLPAVITAAETSQLPLSGDADMYGVALANATGSWEIQGPAFRYAVSPGYFEAMHISVLGGRGLGEDDTAQSPRVVVVSQRLARRLFQDRDPMGHRIRVGPEGTEPYTIVGVAADVKQASLATEETEAIYVPSRQWHWADRVRWMVVHTEGDPMSRVPSIRRAIWSVDGNQPVVRAQPLTSVVAQSEARRRFVLMVISAFALVATALAAIGLYGVISGMVAERLPEMGVRAALGAPRERIVALVVRQGLALTAVGLVLGVLGSLASREALATLLFRVSSLDALTYLAVSAFLLMGAAAACAIPAVRAARVDPARTLRAE
jgi:predicted permease